MKVTSHKKVKRPLRWVQFLVVIVTLAAVAVTVFLGNRVYKENRKMVLDQFNKQQLLLARSAASGIETYFNEINTTLISAARMPAFQRMTPDCLEYMRRIYKGFLSRTSIRRLDENGILRIIYPLEGWRGKIVGRDYNRREFFQKARNTGNVVSEVVINEQGDKRVRVAVPLYLAQGRNNMKGKFNGVLVVSFELNTIAKAFISPILSGETGYAWLIDQDGIFLAHCEGDFIGRNAFKVREEKNPNLSYAAINQIQRKMMAGKEGTDHYVSGWHRDRTERIEKLIAYSPVRINEHIWSVAVCAPVEEVDWIMRATGRTALYAIGLIVLILIAAGGFLFAMTYRWSHFLEREVRERTKELGETSDYLNNLIGCANAPIVVWDQQRRISIFNKAFVEMSGWTMTEMIGQSLDVLFPEDSRSYFMQKVEDASMGKDWKMIEIPILRKDGEIRMGLWSSANIYAEDSGAIIATIVQGQDITERQRVDVALRKIGERYRLIFEQSPLGIMHYDENGIIYGCNKIFAEIIGAPKEKLIGFNMLKSMPDEPARWAIEECLKHGTGNFEGKYHTVSGNKDINIKAVHKRITSDDGVFLGAIGVFEDITERKRAEEALRKSEYEKSVVLDNMSELIFYIDTDMRILWANNAAYKMFGLSSDQVNGKICYEILHNRDKLCGVCPVRKTLKTGEFHETGVVSSYGRKWVLCSNPVRDESGRIMGAIEVVTDITAIKEAEEKLSESEERFRNLVDNLLVGVSIIKNDRIVYQNPENKRLLGPLPESFEFSNFEHVHPDDVEIIKESYRKVLSGVDANLDLDFRFYPFSKNISEVDMKWVQGRASLIKHQGEEAVLFNMMDITRTRELENLINIEDKMSSLGRVATGIAHEIRNPLSTINVYLSALRKIGGNVADLEEKNLNDIQDIIKEIEYSSNKIESVIRKVMDFSKPNVSVLRLRDINQCVEEAVDLSVTTLRKSGVKTEITLQKDIPQCHIDKQSIEQVILNLISNAAEAMERIEGHKQMEISTFSGNNFIIITISDSGPGVPSGVCDKIFEPFYTTKGYGSGIGLSICQRIISDHAGSLIVSTSKWGGAKFTIELPTEKRVNNR